MAGVTGLAVLAVSFVAAPWLWQSFFDVVGLRAGADGGSIFPVSFAMRFPVGAAVALFAGRLALRASRSGQSARGAEALLVVALTIANPTLWLAGLSILVAIVPLWRTGGDPGLRARMSETPPSA